MGEWMGGVLGAEGPIWCPKSTRDGRQAEAICCTVSTAPGMTARGEVRRGQCPYLHDGALSRCWCGASN